MNLKVTIDMLLTVKRLREKLKEFDDDKPVGFVDPYGKFHPISVSDVYMATGHFSITEPDRHWSELVTTTKPKRVCHLNVPQVGVPRGEFSLLKKEKDED